MTAALAVTGLTAGYGSLIVLRDLTFHVDPGEIVVILGANGAGKTTTLRALSGEIPAEGTIELADRQVGGLRADQRARLGIGHVPEGRGTFVDLTVEENLRLGAYHRPAREVPGAMERWFEVFPQLAERRGQLAGSMSGGEQQMLAVARALMGAPKLLLLDEPSMGLAPMLVAELFRNLAEMNRRTGTAMLLVEQNAELALSIADRAYVLEHGRIVSTGTAEELRGDDSIRRAYLGV
ncbi:ABC transporter ATP-binding protein [Streptosporangium sp. NBC_01755]|uniref:ABC transporter ATP-binding protein n=1 Tax=unclassified Streptosporangium TaxID=2632669 RepID=UPI002DDB0AF0|nr:MULTISPECIES: ABC transporter ATP-binding protein [unclassified Streptosporangium]WSA29339.1 ABC transporter ATP-binding protein [Streptosporangium sp. NBC_01810]WSC99218.1 ABC transporter ATP-binding protein [Streptosporangium sp. NBC_01755]